MTDDPTEALAEAVHDLVSFVSASEKLSALGGRIVETMEATKAIADADPFLLPEMHAISQHLLEVHEATTRAREALEARFQVKWPGLKHDNDDTEGSADE